MSDDGQANADDRRQRGLAMMKDVYGWDIPHVEGAFVESTVDHLFADVWTEGTMTINERRLMMIGMAVAGGMEDVASLQLDAAVRLGELDAEDRDIVHGLLLKHSEETESLLAARLLENFDDTAARITKVLPRDYAAVLQTRLDAIEEGLDPDGEEVWSRILEVTGG